MKRSLLRILKSLETRAGETEAKKQQRQSRLDWIAENFIPPFFRVADLKRYFHRWQQAGYHVLPAHFYSPVPNTSELPESLWQKHSDLIGIEMNDGVQLRYLQEIFPHYLEEFDQFPLKPDQDPSIYYHQNPYFVGADALALYCLVRHFHPQRVLEVGSGFSTRLTLSALNQNKSGSLTCVEPHPDDLLKDNPNISKLIPATVQEVALERFLSLEENDILFIDSTHVTRIGSDVNYLFLDVLPRLKKGVIIHVHDIFLPKDYPRAWITESLMFSNEQYLLQAFLIYNQAFEVLFSSSYMTIRYQQEMNDLLSKYPHWEWGCSFWMRKISN